MRRLATVAAVAIVVAISFASRADALTVRDVIELSKAGLSDQVLLALIAVDNRVYTLDADSVRQMKDAGVSDAVMLAMIHAGRETVRAVQPAAPDQESSLAAPSPSLAPQPQVVVIEHADTQPAVREVPVPVPVAVPVAVPYYSPFDLRSQSVSTIITTDSGAAVRARVPVPPNCIKVEPVYWGNGGKRRPGTWAPPPQVVCR